MTLSPLIFLLLQITASLCDEVGITTVDELMALSNDVSINRMNYSGTTVYLDADIDFAEKTSPGEFNPIGKDSRPFLGTFDGQGHTISNLAVVSAGRYVGLIGFSRGSAIRNVVLGPSCAVTCSADTPANVYLGGVLGRCDEGDCTIENSVNMAGIAFRGSIEQDEGDHYLYVGGIVGQFGSDSGHAIRVRNCANYGPITVSGSAIFTRVGGIIGTSHRNSAVRNCLNYGPIVCNGTVLNATSVGGIVGKVSYENATIENCVSAGRIDTAQASVAEEEYVGAVVGGVRSSTVIASCYWTSDVGCTVAFCSGKCTVRASYAIAAPNATVVGALNEYEYDDDDAVAWSKWVLNEENLTVAFAVNGREIPPLASQVVLLPSLVGSSAARAFHGWYSDAECAAEFASSAITSPLTLYGRWGYAVTFDANGGDALEPSTKEVAHGGRYGELPVPTRAGWTCVGWFTGAEDDGSDDDEEVTAETVVGITAPQTLYAHWSANTYYVAFDFGNGTVVEEGYRFGAEVVCPAGTPVREGYTFGGWNVSAGAMLMPDHNVTVKAQWVAARVEIVFGTKSLTEAAVREIIESYGGGGASGKFEIESIVVVGDETLVIVKFVDAKAATDFCRNVMAYGGAQSSLIKRVEYVRDGHDSASSKIVLPSCLYIFMLLILSSSF